jgi:DNA-binding transcriptional MocR family regulator
MTKSSRVVDWRPRLSRERTGSVYLALADALARDIRTGRLAPGARLPSQRALAARLGVNLTTVSRAFDEARRRGLVVGRAGRGTVVTGRPERDAPMPPLVRGARADAADAFVDLTFNTPAFPADARIDEHLASALATIARDRVALRDHAGYQTSGGTEAERRTGLRWIDSRGLAATVGRTLLCAGAQHALAVALQTLARPGDTVLCEALTYPTFKALAAVHGVRLVPVRLDADGIEPEALDLACGAQRPAALFCVPTMHNPTGAVMSAGRRREVAAVVRRHGVSVIEDDVYAPLVPNAPPALAALVPELAWYVTGVSKALAPGLRVGYLVTPSDRDAAAATTTLRTSMWMASPLDAAVVTRWIAEGTAARITRALRDEAALRQALARRVLARGLPKPQAIANGGWHLWLPLPPGVPRGSFVEASRRRGVGVIAADVFAVRDVDAPGGSPVPDAVRLCLGGPLDLAALRRGLEVVRDLASHPREMELTLT